MITLSELLESIEFEYKINDNNTISLIDWLGANLGNIEAEEFEINENLASSLVDRLEIYLDDYHFKGIIDTLIHECQYKDDVYPYNKKLISAMKLYPNQFDDDLIEYLSDIINANIDISELTKG